MDFTVDPRFEMFIVSYIPLISIVSLIFSLVAFYLLATKTPKSSDRYKWYLLNLQIWSTLLDAHFGISFVPVPLFPLIAGYCRGLFCVFHFPMHYSLTILFFLGSELAFAVMLALLFRHQTVIATTSRFKLKARWKVLFLVFLQLLFLIPCFSFLSSRRQAKSDSNGFLGQHPYMEWVTENPEYVSYDSGRLPISFTVKSTGLAETVPSQGILLYFAFCSAVITHILWNFHLNRKVISVKTLSSHNRLTLVVTLQAITISVVLILPILFHALSVITMAFPYEVCWVAYCMQLMFTIAHTTVLISMTPSYSSTILSWFNLHERGNLNRNVTKKLHIANVKYGGRAITVY